MSVLINSFCGKAGAYIATYYAHVKSRCCVWLCLGPCVKLVLCVLLYNAVLYGSSLFSIDCQFLYNDKIVIASLKCLIIGTTRLCSTAALIS